jgi:hypothetical protein
MRNAIVFSLVALGGLGCSSQEPDEPAPPFTGGGQYEYVDPGDAAYPVGPYGWSIGSVVSNLEFIGYHNLLDPANQGAVQYVQLADFYNPVPAGATFNVDPATHTLVLPQGAPAAQPLHGLQDGMTVKLLNGSAVTGNPDPNAIYVVHDVDGVGCKLADFFTGAEVQFSTAGTVGVELAFAPQPVSGYGAGVAKPRALWMITSAVWCGPCNTEAASVLPGEYAELKPLGAHFLTLLMQSSTQGTPATLTDLFNWANGYQVDYSIAIDPEAKAMPLYESSFPGNMIVRTSDMRVIERIAGSPNICLPSGTCKYATAPNQPPAACGIDNDCDTFWDTFDQVLDGTFQDPPEWHQ